MKIAVCVKEVPEASARTRIDPGTPRLDRSGDGRAQPVRRPRARGGAAAQGRDAATARSSLISMGPPRAAESLRKALAIGADRAVHVADDALAGSDLVATRDALAKAVERESPTSSSSASRPATRTAPCSGRRWPTGCGCRSSRRRRASSWADGKVTVEAADRVRLRRDRGAAPCGRRRLGRDQRAALPVAQGDHGREEEAAGDARRSPTSGSRPTRSARPGSPHRGATRSPTRPRAATASASRTTAAPRRADPRVPRRAEARSDGHARLPRAPRGRARQGLARRARRRRRSSAATSPPSSPARA